LALAVGALIYRAIMQFRDYETLSPTLPPADPSLPSISVILPVRNEASNVETCLRSLIAQNYPSEKLEIIVVDDNSNDATADIVRDIAARDGRIKLLQVGALPAGWAGKPHACWIGALASRAEYLCFVDADTIAAPDLLRCAIQGSRERQLDLLSLSPFQVLTHGLDRLVIPLGFLALAVSGNRTGANRSESPDVSVNGQFLLLRAERYFAVGGHSAVRDQICEDVALARLIKSAGLRVAILGGEALIKARMYRTAGELWEGFSKNVTQTFGGNTRTFLIAAGALALGWAAPLLPFLTTIAVMHEPRPVEIASAVLAWCTAVAVISVQVALARHFRIPFWYGLLFPLSCSVGALLALNGVLAAARGRVYWKDRVYASSREPLE
jgi:chlorobactene glucosyltransferase